MTFKESIYRVVRMIPKGKVSTYGEVATWAGFPGAARACGRALKELEDPGVPWHRVINSQGKISGGGSLDRPSTQRTLLTVEGVKFRRSGTCDLRKHRWEGPAEPLEEIESSEEPPPWIMPAFEGLE